MDRVIPPHQLPKFVYEPSVRAVRVAGGLSRWSRPSGGSPPWPRPSGHSRRASATWWVSRTDRRRAQSPQTRSRWRGAPEPHVHRMQLLCAAALAGPRLRVRDQSGDDARAALEPAGHPAGAGAATHGGRWRGPAGLEAARVAAERGHDVALLERATELGGQDRLWATLPGRSIMATTITWYEARLARLRVDVRLSHEASAADVLALKPDTVLVATGPVTRAPGKAASCQLRSRAPNSHSCPRPAASRTAHGRAVGS